jgi:uncharacterized protein (DUF1330 family)
MATTSPRYGTIDQSYARRLATTPPDEDGPVWMTNLMRYRDRADYADGRTSTVTGQEADDLYAPLESIAAVGGEIVFVGTVESQLLGDTPKWDRIGVVKYPTRRAFIEMQGREEFQAAHVHKDAGMAETIIIGGVPISSPPLPADAPGWADVPHPPTAEDGDVMVLHVLRYKEGEERQEMASYTNHAAKIAVPHGVRIAGWFEADGTIVGDGRQWDQVRFNAFPSKEAFMAVVFDPARLEAQRDHREVAIADTYTMILRPTINRLAESVC